MNAFVQWLLSPVSQWHVASMGHKLTAGAVGSLVAWYLYTQKGEAEGGALPTWKIAAYSLAAAYCTSLLLNKLGAPAVAPALPGYVPEVPVEVPSAGNGQVWEQEPQVLSTEEAAKYAGAPGEEYGTVSDEGIFG